MYNERMIMRRIAIGVSGLCVSGAVAQNERVTIYGYEFALVGDPGNRDTNDTEVPMYPDERIGGVDYEFLMATTEATVGQYLEFVEAYYPFYFEATGDNIAFVDFTGSAIYAGLGQLFILQGHAADEPTDMGWEYAARYINWLHHGKVVEDWAFETGVYDTSTFVQDDDGNWLHQAARNPSARFFMPTFDEWTKAGYWDPSKNNGQGGYWLYPNSSDTEPRPGLPGNGGERNAGRRSEGFPLSVGSYPQVRSPWGMLDMSGGQSEYTETPIRDTRLERRILCGTDYLYDDYGDTDSRDILAYGNTNSTYGWGFGLRIGSTSSSQPADLDGDGQIDFFDVSIFIRWFLDGDERADFRKDQLLNLDDVRVFLGLATYEP